ncbi:MAG: methyltransferase domain-containing protein [Armatimonadetes bacterium]|nr:methyltransferase domain-containing protein [Armatimonadota bacterium]
MKLNLGCGARVIDGWVNVDFAPGARLAKIPLYRMANKKLRLTRLDWDSRIVVHDLTKTFPWPDSSADAIYTSHTLEHFGKEEGRRFLEECHRVLRRNGVLRVIVPDFRLVVAKYIEGEIRADDFVSQLGVGLAGRGRSLKDRLAPLFQFPHKCMYDTTRLLEILDELGFVASSRAPFESDIDDVQKLELEDRVTNAVVVEGRKR